MSLGWNGGGGPDWNSSGKGISFGFNGSGGDLNNFSGGILLSGISGPSSSSSDCTEHEPIIWSP
jgi:hypothetical protein